MSIPTINIYTHGTHVTVAHAMGTTIGINMILFARTLFPVLKPNMYKRNKTFQTPKSYFGLLQISLLFLDVIKWAGIKKNLAVKRTTS